MTSSTICYWSVPDRNEPTSRSPAPQPIDTLAPEDDPLPHHRLLSPGESSMASVWSHLNCNSRFFCRPSEESGTNFTWDTFVKSECVSDNLRIIPRMIIFWDRSPTGQTRRIFDPSTCSRKLSESSCVEIIPRFQHVGPLVDTSRRLLSVGSLETT